MRFEEPATTPSWDVGQIRNRLLNGPPGQDTRSQLRAFLDDHDHIQAIRQLEVGERAMLMELIDQVSRCHPPPSDGDNRFIQAVSTVLKGPSKLVTVLGDISSDILLLPNSTGPLRGLVNRYEVPLKGKTTDIWPGTWDNKDVAVKSFRTCPPKHLPEVKKIVWKLAPIWKRLVHENVLPFHGIADTSMFQLGLIYDWGHSGDIVQYLESNTNASRPELVSVHLCPSTQYIR